MRRLPSKIVASLPLLMTILLPVGVMAQVGLTNISRYDSLEEVLIAVFSLLQPVVAIAFIAMVLYGGWTYLTSQGEPEKIARAKQIIVSAIVGFVIIVIAPRLVELIAGILGVDRDLVSV